MMAQEACKYEVAPTCETAKPEEEERRAGAAETWHHAVPERERSHIEKHSPH